MDRAPVWVMFKKRELTGYCLWPKQVQTEMSESLMFRHSLPGCSTPAHHPRGCHPVIILTRFLGRIFSMEVVRSSSESYTRHVSRVRKQSPETPHNFSCILKMMSVSSSLHILSDKISDVRPDSEQSSYSKLVFRIKPGDRARSIPLRVP